jgi:hypothetical protein
MPMFFRITTGIFFYPTLEILLGNHEYPVAEVYVIFFDFRVFEKLKDLHVRPINES